MPDYFALLDEPRRPWLDTEALQKKFLARSADLHPDKSHTANDAEKSSAAETFAELNAAYHCLREPKLRLLHLLELELGAKPKDVQPIPPALADLFAEVATACRSIDAFLAEKSRTTSPLLQVQLFEQAQGWRERLQPLQMRLGTLHEMLISELKSLDAAWLGAETADRKRLLPGLEELYRRFGYCNRWRGQIQERMVQLSL